MTVIIDTGCANINSLRLALERLGDTPTVSADSGIIQSADRLLLPGVGAAGYAMAVIQDRGLDKTLTSIKQPLLGICLGMQLLGSFSEEGSISCLNLIPAKTLEIKTSGERLPHMGWNTLSVVSDHPLLYGIDVGSYFYFVHSYAMPISGSTTAISVYGQPFTAALANDNIMGVQFHPERSGEQGAKLLKNFLDIKL
jgi:glutamine amidotransferase